MSARATTTTRCCSRRRLQLPKCCQCGFWWLCIPGLKLVVYEEKLIGLTREKETQSGVKADWCGPAVVQTQWHWSRPIIGPVLIVHKPTFAASSYQLVNHCIANNNLSIQILNGTKSIQMDTGQIRESRTIFVQRVFKPWILYFKKFTLRRPYMIILAR